MQMYKTIIFHDVPLKVCPGTEPNLFRQLSPNETDQFKWEPKDGVDKMKVIFHPYYQNSFFEQNKAEETVSLEFIRFELNQLDLLANTVIEKLKDNELDCEMLEFEEALETLQGEITEIQEEQGWI